MDEEVRTAFSRQNSRQNFIVGFVFTGFMMEETPAVLLVLVPSITPGHKKTYDTQNTKLSLQPFQQ